VPLPPFFPWRNNPKWATASPLSRVHDHTQINHTQWYCSGRVISPAHRPLPDNTCILIVIFRYSYCLYALLCISVFIVPTRILRLPGQKFFRAFSSVVRQIPRKDGARSALFLISEMCCSKYCLCRLCCSVYCLRVNVYCTTAIGWQPNCS
jgi:hypothetical protein